jgi:hypothetical protein
MDGSSEVHSFTGQIFKCDGFYNKTQIFRLIPPNLWWIVLVGLLLALLFTVILNSYWPILISIYNTLKRLINFNTNNSNNNSTTSVHNDINNNDNNSSTQESKSSFKDKLLFVWIVVCFFCTFVAALIIAAMIITFWIFNSEQQTDPICTELIPSSSSSSLSSRLTNDGSYNTVQIMSQDDNGMTLLMPCDSVARDEFNHTYQFKGPFELVCSDYIDFDYLDLVEVWHNDKCCFDVEWEKAWNDKSINKSDKIQGGKDWKARQAGCGTCWNRCAARYRCTRHKVSMQRCHYQETSLSVIIDNIEREYIQNSISVGPAFQSPYGFWRNETSTILNTATNNFLEGTNFNYSCKPTNSPRCRDDYIFPQPVITNPLPQLSQCEVIAHVDFHITCGGLLFCDTLMITENTETGGVGFKVENTNDSCVVKVVDDANITFYITLSPGSYRFFLQVEGVACKDRGNGLYTDCDDNEVYDINPFPMSYDWGADIVTVGATNTGSGGFHFSNPFEKLFSSVASTIVTWVIIIFVILAILVVGFIILRCVLLRTNCCCPHAVAAQALIGSPSA